MAFKMLGCQQRRHPSQGNAATSSVHLIVTVSSITQVGGITHQKEFLKTPILQEIIQIILQGKTYAWLADLPSDQASQSFSGWRLNKAGWVRPIGWRF